MKNHNKNKFYYYLLSGIIAVFTGGFLTLSLIYMRHGRSEKSFLYQLIELIVFIVVINILIRLLERLFNIKPPKE